MAGRNHTFSIADSLRTLAGQLIAAADVMPNEVVTDDGADVAPNVVKSKLQNLTGYTDDQIKGYKARGFWIEGVHFIVNPAGTTMYKFEEIVRWEESQQIEIAQQVSNCDLTGTLESESGSRANGSRSDANFQQLLEAYKTRRKCAKKSTANHAQGQ